MTDTITLTGLRAQGRHGVYEFEREQGQEFVVDAVLELDLSAAAGSDRLADTVDYGALAGALVAVVTGPPVQLIETLATRLAEVCLADPRVAAASVTVHKPQAPVGHEFTDVSVTRRLSRSTPAGSTARVAGGGRTAAGGGERTAAGGGGRTAGGRADGGRTAVEGG